jgi:hypothetical protein
MISQEQADKIVIANNLRDAVKLLGGTMHKSMTLNSQGISSNKITIVYNEINEKSQTKEV